MALGQDFEHYDEIAEYDDESVEKGVQRDEWVRRRSESVIASLLDQARDKDNLANGDDDSIFADDAKYLREAATLLKAQESIEPIRSEEYKSPTGEYSDNFKVLEKIRKGLDACMPERIRHGNCRECPYDGDVCWSGSASIPVAMLDDIRSLMKAQEPVSPTIGGNHEYERDGSWWYQCGNCKMPIDPKDKYCRECGRKVKWE